MLLSCCRVGNRLLIFDLITRYINEQVNRPSFLMTTFFLLSMGECVLEAESGSMRGEFLCATAADIFFSMTKSGMEEGSTFGVCNQKIYGELQRRLLLSLFFIIN